MPIENINSGLMTRCFGRITHRTIWLAGMGGVKYIELKNKANYDAVTQEIHCRISWTQCSSTCRIKKKRPAWFLAFLNKETYHEKYL